MDGERLEAVAACGGRQARRRALRPRALRTQAWLPTERACDRGACASELEREVAPLVVRLKAELLVRLRVLVQGVVQLCVLCPVEAVALPEQRRRELG